MIPSRWFSFFICIITYKKGSTSCPSSVLLLEGISWSVVNFLHLQRILYLIDHILNRECHDVAIFYRITRTPINEKRSPQENRWLLKPSQVASRSNLSSLFFLYLVAASTDLLDKTKCYFTSICLRSFFHLILKELINIFFFYRTVLVAKNCQYLKTKWISIKVCRLMKRFIT